MKRQIHRTYSPELKQAALDHYFRVKGKKGWSQARVARLRQFRINENTFRNWVDEAEKRSNGMQRSFSGDIQIKEVNQNALDQLFPNPEPRATLEDVVVALHHIRDGIDEILTELKRSHGQAQPSLATPRVIMLRKRGHHAK